MYKISNFAEEKIFAIAVEIKVARYQVQKNIASQKYRFRQISVEIKVARYQAQKKYWLHKNIGINKIASKLRWRVIKRSKKIGVAKISVSTK